MGILDYVLSEDLSIRDYVTQLKTKVPDVLCPLTQNANIIFLGKSNVSPPGALISPNPAQQQ